MSEKHIKKGQNRARVVGFEKDSNGRETWRVAANGRIYESSTSSSSATVMDEAVRTYGTALERLAKR